MRKLSSILLSTIAAVVAVAPAHGQGSVIRLDPALDDIVSPDLKVEVLADSPEPVSREGPVWVRDGGYLLYSVLFDKINKWNPADGKVSTFMANMFPNAITVDPQGRIVYCLFSVTGQVVRLEKDGRRTVLASQYEGKPLQGPNDLVYKSDGALYFTTTGINSSLNPDTVPSVFLLKDGKLQLLTTPAVVAVPNGLAFSPDEKYLYTTESNKRLMRFDVQSDDTIANGKVFIDMRSVQAEGAPDGMKVDEKGNVYSPGPAGLWIISPEGKHIGTIIIPGRAVNLAFGEADGKTLFVTGRPGLYRISGLKIPGIRP